MHPGHFTTNFEQAKTWACKNNAEGAVYECYLDLSEINHLSYTNKDQDLYYLLYLCRIDLEDVAKETVKNYREIDLVIGPVLDGKVKKFNDIAEQFNSGEISFEDFLRNIEFFQGYNQWCVKSQKLIDHINNNKIILHEVKR